MGATLEDIRTYFIEDFHQCDHVVESIGPGEKTFFTIFSILMGILSFALMLAFLLPFFLKPKPWVWTYNLVLICIGLSSACFLIVCVPLLIAWIKPHNKAWHGRT